VDGRATIVAGDTRWATATRTYRALGVVSGSRGRLDSRRAHRLLGGVPRTARRPRDRPESRGARRRGVT